MGRELFVDRPQAPPARVSIGTQSDGGPVRGDAQEQRFAAADAAFERDGPRISRGWTAPSSVPGPGPEPEPEPAPAPAPESGPEQAWPEHAAHFEGTQGMVGQEGGGVWAGAPPP